MSETLEERLSSHSNAFDGLLSLIPAKYYYDDESKNQWAKKNKSEAKLESKKRKLARLDPDVKLTALDQKQKIEEESSKAKGNNDAQKKQTELASEDSEGGHEDEDEDEDVELELQGAIPGGEEEDEDEDDTVIFDDGGNLVAPKKQENEQPSTNNKKSEEKRTSSSVEVSTDPSSSNGDGTRHTKKVSAQNISELRDRLALKIQEMREKRKAPGSGAKGAPSSREAILEARRDKKRKRKEAPNGEVESKNAKVVEENIEEDEGDDEDESSVLFGGVEFKDGQRATADLKALKEQKKTKGPKDILGQIKHLEAKKRRIASLDTEKRTEIQEKAQWSKAILQAEGKKVNDDEKLLKKSLKQQQKKKKKSEKEWKERIYTVGKNIKKRQAKREENLNIRKQMKGVKGKTQKDKMKKKIATNRPGFEGKKK